jgi:hypothetical protein
MAATSRNTLAIILWIFGLLGATGYLNPFGFFALLIPILFILLGSQFTQQHARQYFNILVTSVVIWLLGHVLNWIVGLFDVKFDMLLIALIYFGIMCLFGLIQAINDKKFKNVVAIQIFK